MSVQKTLFYQYDVPAALTYGVFMDINPVALDGWIETDGSSTTTTAVEASGLGSFPFAPAIEGDRLAVFYDDPADNLVRSIATKTSNSAVVVNAAWDLTDGKPVKLWPFRSGTEVTDGWTATDSYKRITIKINVESILAAAVRMTIEGKMSGPDATAFTIFDTSYTVAGSDVFTITEPWSFLRVGLEEVGAAGVDSVSVYLTAEDNTAVGS